MQYFNEIFCFNMSMLIQRNLSYLNYLVNVLFQIQNFSLQSHNSSNSMQSALCKKCVLRRHSHWFISKLVCVCVVYGAVFGWSIDNYCWGASLQTFLLFSQMPPGTSVNCKFILSLCLFNSFLCPEYKNPCIQSLASNNSGICSLSTLGLIIANLYKEYFNDKCKQFLFLQQQKNARKKEVSSTQ